MYSFTNKYRGSRNGSGGSQPKRGIHRPKFFDPTNIILSSQKELPALTPTEPVVVATPPLYADLALDPRIKTNIATKGYTHLTPIQEQAIPAILSGRDVVGIANTGTGKTAAFLLPLIEKVIKDNSQMVLVIAPTRELAVQIRDELHSLAQGLNIDSVLAIGGVSSGPQAHRLRRNPQFVIGTPGRLKDLEQMRALHLDYFQTIVLDEVDRMLDIGFVREIKHIIASLPRPRHSLFFSATVTPEVQTLMQSFLTNPITISVKTNDSLTLVRQELVKLNGQSRIEVLQQLLTKSEFGKVLIFGRTKFGMEKLARELERRGFTVAAIHGNKNQNQRQKALNDFKTDRIQILLATDIASRGIDVSGITHVINYELPETYESYIHRIGRTGRAQKSGTAITFVD